MTPDFQQYFLEDVIRISRVRNYRTDAPSYRGQVPIRQNRKTFRSACQRQFDKRAVFEGCELWGHRDLPRL